MKSKALNFMELLEAFFTEYMPFSAGLSENTIRSYKYAFRLLIEFLFSKKNLSANEISFARLDFDVINGFLLWIEEERNCSVTTRNLRLAALSSFASYAQNRNIDAATVFMNAVKKVSVKPCAAKPRTLFSLEEVTVLLKLPNCGTAIGYRDNTLLNLMYASGARAQEICDLTVRCIQFQVDVTKLTITGKGGKTRRINIARPCGALLRQYLTRRGILNAYDRHIFSSQTHEHMTVSCVEEIFKKYIKLAKEQNPLLFREPRYSPHSMRHTTATHMLEAGIPLMAIKNFLGHASVTTTERYAELSQSTVNRHIKEWNERWFPMDNTAAAISDTANVFPVFLR
ncbi:MAG: tyrosine-type recombinase/integrase [Clostridiales bacterium]|nr:tyrosine-type recombinase/integrase [Clostridiales bacterium]